MADKRIAMIGIRKAGSNVTVMRCEGITIYKISGRYGILSDNDLEKFGDAGKRGAAAGEKLANFYKNELATPWKRRQS
jgi:hypothetical protein